MRSYEGEGPKQFKVGFRGYRREPVDEYVERLHQWLVDSEARAEDAVEAATAAVGERAAEILRAALGVGRHGPSGSRGAQGDRRRERQGRGRPHDGRRAPPDRSRNCSRASTTSPCAGPTS